ncbi:hypothetical protein E4U37_001950 [Claviceps purpurea]|nr:hypothetical protein E4U37_001950 [Claviceps purpurea]
MAGKPKLLVLGAIEHAHEAWSRVAQIADVLTPKAKNREDFIAEAQSGAFDGVVVAYRTFESFAVTGKVNNELLDALPSSLKFLCHNGAGYDQIDIPSCSSHGIRVSNTPTAVDDSTADTTIWLLLGALRNFAPGMSNLRAGEWRGNIPPRLGHDPQGKILGILGMGGIGRNVAAKAKAFGMKVRYHNRTKLSEELEGGAEYVPFERLLAESDVLSLNLPLNPKTRHIISKQQFDIMKAGIIIVNTSRGAVMDEAALVDALHAGKVASAGLDVYEDEPTIHPGLLKNQNVVLLPHMGTYTVETETKMEEWAIDNVKMALEGGQLKSIVPEQKDLV